MTPLVVILLLAVGPHIVFQGVAAASYLSTSGEATPPEPTEWPSVSIGILPGRGPIEETVASVLACNYPEDRIDIVAVARPGDQSASLSKRGPVDVTSIRPQKDDLQALLDRTTGDVLAVIRAGAAVPPTWIRSLVLRCATDDPAIRGPSLVDHEDLFLPRLQALHRLAGLALSEGLGRAGFFEPDAQTNAALDRTRATKTQSSQRTLSPGDVDFENRIVSEPEAAVLTPPAPTFPAYVRSLAKSGRRCLESASWPSILATTATWVAHTVLLICCTVALAVPAWRQPTLLALLGKMGVDGILTVPPARAYGQRALTRSFVPSELSLLMAVPAAGILAWFEQTA